ncbi:MAG: PepSY domain-containing protein [Gammaproteobacteria bacterium]|nr:PepSY domain-containing protein [Gammaproteobacteria bacterium]
MNNEKRRSSTIRRLHRSLGAFAAVFVLFMVLSGIVINHSNGLGLDQRHVSQSLLLDWYGLDAPERIRGFSVGDDWVIYAGSQVFLNKMPVSTISGGVGAVFNHQMLIAAGSDELLLLDAKGQLIERQPWGPSGTGPIESIGLLPDATVVVKSTGQFWLADADLLGWKPSERIDKDVTWSTPETAPLTLIESVTEQYRGGGPSVERLLLDLHSGRVFGPIGVFVYDLLALVVGLLSISGLVMWFKNKRNGKRSNGVS